MAFPFFREIRLPLHVGFEYSDYLNFYAIIAISQKFQYAISYLPYTWEHPSQKAMMDITDIPRRIINNKERDATRVVLRKPTNAQNSQTAKPTLALLLHEQN
jgi:hypothetical protein